MCKPSAGTWSPLGTSAGFLLSLVPEVAPGPNIASTWIRSKYRDRVKAGRQAEPESITDSQGVWLDSRFPTHQPVQPTPSYWPCAESLLAFFKCEYLLWGVSCPKAAGHFASTDGKQRVNEDQYQDIKPESQSPGPYFLLRGSSS